MLSLNVKFAVIVMLLQQSCSSVDFELARYLLIEVTERFIDKDEECQQPSGTAIFVNPVEQISC